MPDYTEHYAETERRLRELLQKTAGMLTARYLAEAWSFLAEHEYGLALETITEGLGKQPIEPDAAKLIDVLMASMEMTA
jgi:hypothetical protein